MKTEDLLYLDCRKKENANIIQKALRRLKPFLNEPIDEEIELNKLEKLIKVLITKYDIQPQWITFNVVEEKPYYTCSLKRSSNHSLLGTIYGASIYEVYAKILIKMHYEIKTENVKKKGEE